MSLLILQLIISTVSGMAISYAVCGLGRLTDSKCKRLIVGLVAAFCIFVSMWVIP